MHALVWVNFNSIRTGRQKKTVTENIRGMETRYSEDPVTNGAEIAQSL